MVGEVTTSAGVDAVRRRAAHRAEAWRHHWLGTEHLLLGFLDAEGEDRAAPLLLAAGLSIKVAEAAVLALVPPRLEREPAWDGVLDTPRVQRICGVAEGWARADRWPAPAEVGLDHLLLALLLDGDGVAAQVVIGAGLDVTALTADLAGRLRRL